MKRQGNVIAFILTTIFRKLSISIQTSVVLSKTYLTSHSRMSGSRSVITSS